MNTDEKSKNAEEEVTVPNRVFLILILGCILVVVGITFTLVAAVFYGVGSASLGGVIFIGPFPILIGAGPETTLMVVFGIIIAVLSVIMFLVMNRGSRRSRG